MQNKPKSDGREINGTKEEEEYVRAKLLHSNQEEFDSVLDDKIRA